MYNSLLVSMFAKIWFGILHGYESSFIKKIVDLIKRIISYLVNGSILVNVFTNNQSLIEKSIFYKAFAKTMDLITLIFSNINKYINKIGQHSLIYKSISSLFSSEIELIRSFSMFIFFFGIGIIGNNITRGLFSGRSYIIAMILIIGALIGLFIKEDYKEILASSLFYRFVAGIFIIDEGGGNWW